jgi:hypothetical protein
MCATPSGLDFRFRAVSTEFSDFKFYKTACASFDREARSGTAADALAKPPATEADIQSYGIAVLRTKYRGHQGHPVIKVFACCTPERYAQESFPTQIASFHGSASEPISRVAQPDSPAYPQLGTLRVIRERAMTKVSTTERVVAVLLGAGLGVVASMGVLRVFHDWAFRTEFIWWLRMTAIHSCIVFVVFALWFGIIRPNVRSAFGIANCVGAVVVGGLVAVFVPFGFVLVITGQAFITSGTATLAYIAVSALEDR